MISKQPKKTFKAETYLGTCQAPMIFFFFENSYRLLPAILAKNSNVYFRGSNIRLSAVRLVFSRFFDLRGNFLSYPTTLVYPAVFTCSKVNNENTRTFVQS